MSSLMKEARWQLAQMIADDVGIDWEATPYEIHVELLGAAQYVLDALPNSVPGLAATWRAGG